MATDDKIDTKDGLAILAKQVPPVLLATVSALAAVNPAWSVLFATAVGLINVWGDFGQARINELVEDINKHKDEFKPEILETDKFKSIFLNVLEVHMKETMSDKRILYRNYLLNVGKGVRVDFDYHSKLLAILNLITFDEIHALEEVILAFDTIRGEHKGSLNYNPPMPNADELSVKLKGMNREYAPGLRWLMLHMRSLQTYNLILTGESVETNTGAPSLKVEAITDFGRVFLAFIAEPVS